MPCSNHTAQLKLVSVRPSIATLCWQFLQCQLMDLGSRAIAYFTQENEPRVSCHTQANGEIFWSVYDPASGQSSYCSSEAEVRYWLEVRRYQ